MNALFYLKPIAVCLLMTTAIAAAQESLLKEGDMEVIEETDGVSVPRGWSVLKGEATVPAIEAEAGTVHEGSHALKVATAESPLLWVRSRQVVVQPDTEYELSVAILTQGAGTVTPFYGIRVYESDGGWNPKDGQPYLIQRESLRDNGKDWQVKTARFHTRSNTKWLYIGLLTRPEKQQGFVLFDSIILQPVL